MGGYHLGEEVRLEGIHDEQGRGCGTAQFHGGTLVSVFQFLQCPGKGCGIMDEAGSRFVRLVLA